MSRQRSMSDGTSFSLRCYCVPMPSGISYPFFPQLPPPVPRWDAVRHHEGRENKHNDNESWSVVRMNRHAAKDSRLTTPSGFLPYKCKSLFIIIPQTGAEVNADKRKTGCISPRFSKPVLVELFLRFPERFFDEQGDPDEKRKNRCPRCQHIGEQSASRERNLSRLVDR